MTDRELMQQALEALEQYVDYEGATSSADKAITALRERLAQPERTWVGLTDEEIKIIKTSAPCNDTANCGEAITFGRAIEAKLKEKNT